MKSLVLALAITSSLSISASVNNKASQEANIDNTIKNIQIQITTEGESNKTPANVNDSGRTHNEKELTLAINN